MTSEGGTVTFIATSSGITDKKELMYLWKKNGKNRLPDKALGHRSTLLTIPNLMENDTGEYYCTVTNEWGISVRSKYITLTVQGNRTFKMLVSICIVAMHAYVAS